MAPADEELAAHCFLHAKLNKVLALQVAYIARCCEATLHLATARVVEKFKHTWETRLASYRSLPDGTERSADDPASRPDLVIGFVGCGIIGTGVARTLIDAGISPSQLLISTRSPNGALLRELSARGAWVGFDNRKVAARAHLLVVATLPSQLAEASRDVRQALTKRTLVLSLAGGVPSPKLRSMFGTSNALQLRAETERVREALAHHVVLGTEEQGGSSAAVGAPLPSATLASLASRALLADISSADELASLLGRTMMHGLELDDEAVSIGKKALVADVSAVDDKVTGAAPTLSQVVGSFRDFLSGLLPDVDAASAGAEAVRLAPIRAHFINVSRRALLQCAM